MRFSRRAWWVIGSALLLLRAQPAWAPFHEMVIDEIFFGDPECPRAQYVKLRTLTPGQVFVQGQPVDLQNADGSDAGEFGRFAAPLPNAAEGVSILMATAEAEALFGIEADTVVSGQLVFPDGRVCFGVFVGPVDCVAYGNFTGDNTGNGQPAVQPQLGMALVRVAETHDNANDFALGVPAPRNNAGDVGTAGQCPADTPTPSPTPITTPTPTIVVSACTGDCSNNNVVTVDELVTGVNIAVGAAELIECLAFDRNLDLEVKVDELVTGVNNTLEGCPALPTPTPTPSPRPTFIEPLGRRRFSLDPTTSSFRIAGLPIQLASPGFEGFIEFEAGLPDPVTGIASVDIVDTSDFLSILLRPAIGNPIAICIRPVREQLPVVNAGVLSCFGGYDFSTTLTIDHNIGEVGVDGFTEADCTAAGGEVEPPGGAHPGVCNGPIVAGQAGGDSGAGALAIAPDQVTLEHPFNVVLTMEDALPCGDEGAAGLPFPLVLTSGIAQANVVDSGNTPGAQLDINETGVNFSCVDWTQEDGPGRLVFAAPLLDLDTQVIGFFDTANVFVFTD